MMQCKRCNTGAIIVLSIFLCCVEAAAGTVKIADAEISVQSISVGKVTMDFRGQKRESQNVVTSVTISIKNTGSQTINYYTWRERGIAALIDQSGHRFESAWIADPRLLTGNPPGGITRASADIAPGETLTDVLLFDAMGDAPKTLSLELDPLSILRKSGGKKVTLTIPPEVIAAIKK